MSREYVVLIVDEPPEDRDVEDMPARIFMRFTQEPAEDYLLRLAKGHPGKRVYCLMGASSWYAVEAP